MNGDIFCLLPCGRAAYGLIERPNDFASYLLAIAICNLLLYFAFYIIMKVCVCAYIRCSHTGFRAELGFEFLFCICVQLRSGERIQCLALVCILFTAVVWGFALYFFFQGLSTWQVSNSEMHTRTRSHRVQNVLNSYMMPLCFVVCSENSSRVSRAQQGLHLAFILWWPWYLALPVLHRHVWIFSGIIMFNLHFAIHL